MIGYVGREGGREGGREDRGVEGSVRRLSDGIIDISDGTGNEAALVEGVAARHGEGLPGARLSVWQGRRVGEQESQWTAGRSAEGRGGSEKHVQAKIVPLYPCRTESTTALATRW